MRSKNLTKHFSFPEVPEKSIRLHLNESKEVLPTSYLKALQKEVKHTLIGTYPSPSVLQKQVAKYVGVQEEMILLMSGSDQGIELLFQNYFEGKSIALQNPSFLAYRHLADKYEVNVVPVEYDDYVFSLPNALDALSKADGIALSNPGNPIGAKISQNDLETIAQKAHEKNKICIIDEAYFEFLQESFVSKLHEFESVVILRTFSKAFGLAGLRVGYLVGSGEIVGELKKLQLPCPVSSFALLAASLALKEEKIFSKSRQKVIEKKELFERLLKESNFSLLPTYTNFSNIKVDDPNEFAAALKEEGVIVMSLQGLGLLRVAIPEKPKEIAKIFKKVGDLQN